MDIILAKMKTMIRKKDGTFKGITVNGIIIGSLLGSFLGSYDPENKLKNKLGHQIIHAGCGLIVGSILGIYYPIGIICITSVTCNRFLTGWVGESNGLTYFKKK